MATATMERPITVVKPKPIAKTTPKKTIKKEQPDEPAIIYSTTAAVTKSGQVSLPREIANYLEMDYTEGNRLRYDVLENDTIRILREPTFWERLEKLHSSFTPEQRAAMKADARKTASEIKDEWAKSPAGKTYFKEKYGL